MFSQTFPFRVGVGGGFKIKYKTMKYILVNLLIAVAVLATLPVQAQQKLNMTSLLKSGQATDTHTPLDIGTIYSVFDGSFNSLARCHRNNNPMVITITFADAYDLSRSRMLSATPARWTLEVAATAADMSSRSGTYRKLINNLTISQNVYRDYTLSNATGVKVVRVTLYRTTHDYYPHMREWELYGNVVAPPPYNFITIEPDNVYTNVGETQQYVAYGVYSDGSRTLLNHHELAWSTNNPAVATINSGGIATAQSPGEALIKAIYTHPTGTVRSTTTNITVMTQGVVCR